MNICVYCAANREIDKSYFIATELLAKELAHRQIGVVYGGGAVGLMGKLADTILENGGKIKGIIPRFMYDLGWAHKGVTDMIVTESMHERKAKYLENIDAIIALPGGSGTLEELLEVITLKQLGQFSKPIVILNTDGFYDPLKEMFTKCIEEHFIKKTESEIWTFVEEPMDVISTISKQSSNIL